MLEEWIDVYLSPYVEYNSQIADLKKKFVSSTNFISNYNAEFHENPTNGSVADVTSQAGRQANDQTDRRTWSSHKAFTTLVTKEGAINTK